MEKKKNIWLFPVLLAWAIIFAHDVIPHFHHSDQFCNLNHHQHESHKYHDSCCEEFQDSDSEHRDCHFSVDLLTHFSLDQEFDLPGNNYNVFSVLHKGLQPYFTDHLKTKPLYLVQNHMRAPPAE